MMPRDRWYLLFKKEISDAEEARMLGNEGKARVCARRAAGEVIREYCRRNQIQMSNQGAFSLLGKISSLPQIDDDAREVLSHFLVRITKDKTLPIDADLIADAKWLADRLIT